MGRVGLIGQNSVRYIDALIDIWNAGDCAVLLDWRIPYQIVVDMMKEANIYKCYIEKKQYDKWGEPYFENIEIVIFEKEGNYAEYLPNIVYEKYRENYSENEAVVLYSSGTTGKAKGIILSHAAISINADSIIEYMKPRAEDCIYVAKSLTHSSTIVGELLVALKTHTSLVIAPIIVPLRFVLRNIEKFKVSIICLNPTLLKAFVEEFNYRKYLLSNLRTIYVSGSIMNEKLFNIACNVLTGIDIYNVYGLSEAGPRVTAQREGCCNDNSVGRPIKGVEIAVVNEKGEIVNQGERGIVHVNTPCKYDGYIVGEKKFESFYRDWLNTGDVGYINTYGNLIIEGRYDDLIIVNSYKIYPCDIEKIALNLDEIDECLAMSDKGVGIIFVYVTKEKRYIANKLMKLFRENLAYYEIPTKLICVDIIPKTPNGKIDVLMLKKQLQKEGGE